MPTELRDYYVTFHREEYVDEIAQKWRRAYRGATRPDFNIVSFVEETLTAHLSSRKGKLHIKFFDMKNEDDLPAYVSIDPLTLNIDQELWELARAGDPFARRVVAHEVGHIILHGHYDKAAFSSDPALRSRAFVKENSAEWQADTFAGYFLLPTRLVAAFSSPAEIAAACSVPLELAQTRFAEVREQQLRKRNGRDLCPVCSQFGCVEFH